MGFGFSGTSSTVAVTGSIATTSSTPTPSSAQTFKRFRLATVAVTDMYTVPAGKKVTVVGLSFFNSSGAANQVGHLYATDGATVIASLACASNYESKTAGGFPFAVYAAGEIIKAYTTHASAPFHIYAIEEAV